MKVGVRLSHKAARRARGAVGRVAVLAFAAGACGCATVPPYQRGKLAHPTMTPDDMTSIGEAHLRAISEGATGGAEGSGSGCGCN